MAVLTNIAWILVGLEACLVVAWILFALKTVGRDPQERVVTLLFTGLGIGLVCLAGGLLFYGQSRRNNSLLWLGFLVAAFPTAGLLAVIGREGFIRLRARRRSYREQASGRFQDPVMTAMVAAINRCDETVLKALLTESRPDWTARNHDGRTLLGHAIHRAITDYSSPDTGRMIECLVAAGARLGSNDLNSSRPLMTEVLAANTPGAVALLEGVLRAGGDPNGTDAHQEPLVHLMECTSAKLRVLARYGADLHVPSQRADRPGWTALMTAVAMSDWEKAHFLLDQGVSIEHRGKDGNTVRSLFEQARTRFKTSGEVPKPGFQEFRERLKACPNNRKGTATRDFGAGLGGEA